MINEEPRIPYNIKNNKIHNDKRTACPAHRQKKKGGGKALTIGMIDQEYEACQKANGSQRSFGKYINIFLFWFWPLLIVGVMYIISMIHPQFFQTGSSYPPNQNLSDFSQGYNRNSEYILSRRNHYTICQEEITENKNIALVKSIVLLHGDWSEDEIANLLNELQARYGKRTDFYNYASPTDISITVTDRYQSKGERTNYIARLYVRKGSAAKIQWNPKKYPGKLAHPVEYNTLLVDDLHQALRAFKKTEPEISILPGYDNPNAFQISVIDHRFHGNPKYYAAVVAEKAKEFLLHTTQPCEGIFIALFDGNYYITPESCMSLQIKPTRNKNPYLLADLVWDRVGKNEFLKY